MAGAARPSSSCTDSAFFHILQNLNTSDAHILGANIATELNEGSVESELIVLSGYMIIFALVMRIYADKICEYIENR